MTPRAAIWDMDGTLVDTWKQHFAAWQQAASEIGRHFSLEQFAVTFGRRNPEIIRAVFDADASDEEIATLGERKEVLYRDAAKREGVALLPGVRKLLDGLRDVGWRQGVGSSAPRANLELLIELTKTSGIFSAVVAAEDTTRGKPDPQVFLTAAERLGVAPARCVVFEDALAGVEAARAAGMRCVAVQSHGHHSADALRDAGANLVVDSLSELATADIEQLLRG